MAASYRYTCQDGDFAVDLSDSRMPSSTAHMEPMSHEQASEPTESVRMVTDSHPSSGAMEEVRQTPIDASASSPSTDSATSPSADTGGARFPEKPPLSSNDLAKRDREAVAYSKALLLEGDTLVYITYPGDSKCFDSTGFEISAGPYRVHSGRLLATGSTVFAKLLSPTYQYRILRRKKLVGNLPLGIKYVLDLTPPDEGEEAVQLTSELSCSLGVRLWYTAGLRCRISSNLVGGEDEVMDPRNVTSYGAPIVGMPKKNQESHDQEDKSFPGQPTGVSPQPNTWESGETMQQEREMADAVRMSLEDLSRSTARQAGKGDLINVPDYCPIRHRAGIGRLLRVLEGKDPHLDSAPKVWTLFVLAKYFDCTAAVVDWIVSWVIADPNTQFIEILPEASCKMAFGLKNQMIGRAAFSVLVSEEALSLASREAGRVEADRKGTNQFGRLREDNDEDIRTRIEYASKNFASRVCDTFEALVEENMTWMAQLPEYQKLKKFKDIVLRYIDSKDQASKQASKWLSNIDQLSFDLRSYVRSRILSYLSSSLPSDLATSATNHRRAERYTNAGALKADVAFSEVYDKLLEKERIFTRFFWLFLLYADFPISFHGELSTDSDLRNREAYLAGVRPTISALLGSQEELNASILEAIRKKLFDYEFVSSELLPKYSENPHSGDYATHNISNSNVPISKANTPEAKRTMKLWNPFASKSHLASKEVQFADGDGRSTSNMGGNFKDNWDKSKEAGHGWDPWISDSLPEDTRPLISRETSESNSDPRNAGRSTESADLGAMDADEYRAMHHLLDSQFGLEKAVSSEKGLAGTNSDLPFRPKAQNPTSIAQDLEASLSEKRPASSQTVELSGSPGVEAARWTHDGLLFEVSYLSRIIRLSQGQEGLAPAIHPVSHPSLKPAVEPAVKPTALSYDKISALSPIVNVSKVFQEAKEHIRKVATCMLDQREMGFDVALTDTILSLGPEEFKYLPLWAGGDDDGSGGVFDDTIPFPVAGPNGPGPSFHTGFSSASATSSEFDAMSDRTGFNTSVAVEDGFSDHIDRRLVVSDDDFHSETFSEDSEIYDRKGKGVDRSGFYTSAPASEAAFSAADTTNDSLAEIKALELDEGNEMDYEVEDSDADTTIGLADDEDENEAFDGGDDESFDFGDSDEEMTNI